MTLEGHDAERDEAVPDELREARAALEAAARAQRDILSVVSHDLRNALSPILLATVALQRTAPVDDVGRKKLEIIARWARRADRLIDDVVDFANLRAGRLELALSAEDPQGLVDEAVRTLEPVVAAHGQTLERASDGRPQAVTCDRRRVLQALGYLVGNAASVSPPGATLRVRVSAGADEVTFSVSDPGPGFSREILDQLFDRFATGREGPYKGTGLGLAVAEGLIRAHGGRIWAESAVGVGTTFSFTLPATAPSARGQGPQGA